MYPYNIKNEPKNNISIQETERSQQNKSTNTNSYDSTTTEMIKKSMQFLSDDSEFYKEFAGMFDDINTKEMILKMYLKKCTALKMLSEIYFKITDERLNTPAPTTPDLSDNIAENAETEMFNELNNFEYLRTLLFTLLSVGFRDMLYEIITDMQSNTQILNYIYNKYR